MRSGLGRLGAIDRGVLLLIGLFALLLALANPRVYATDEVQYYVYLRSLRFDGDLDFANDYQEFARRNPRSGIEDSLLQANRIRPATGLYGNIAPVGCALMWAPFFLLADAGVHAANLLGAGIPADGFSRPYITAVCYASALYGLLGLLLCRRLARRYATGAAATLATVVVWLATPLVFYMFIQMPFAHSTGFFLTSLFVTIWSETRRPSGQSGRSYRAWALLGAVGALMTMTREQLGLFLLLPALEGLAGYVAALRRQPGQIRALLPGQLLFGAVFVLMLTPQIAAYQVLNGSPRPAGEVSGRINWCSPHLIDTLVDYNPAPSAWCQTVGDFTADFPAFSRGALVWSPVLLPALAGLALLARRDAGLAALLAAVFLAQCYINGAYGTTWHLRGAFGFRRLIECTPIFVLGLAPACDWLARRTGWRALYALGAALVAWNAGLVVNATFFEPETNMRRIGLLWPDVWRWQWEAPFKVAARLREIIFERCRFLQNGSC
jgi:hypothetical protein